MNREAQCYYHVMATLNLLTLPIITQKYKSKLAVALPSMSYQHRIFSLRTTSTAALAAALGEFCTGAFVHSSKIWDWWIKYTTYPHVLFIREDFKSHQQKVDGVGACDLLDKYRWFHRRIRNS